MRDVDSRVIGVVFKQATYQRDSTCLEVVGDMARQARNHSETEDFQDTMLVDDCVGMSQPVNETRGLLA